MSKAFLTTTPHIRTRTPIAQMFSELLCDDNEDMLFVDYIDQLGTHSVYFDGRTMAHIQEH